MLSGAPQLGGRNMGDGGTVTSSLSLWRDSAGQVTTLLRFTVHTEIGRDLGLVESSSWIEDRYAANDNVS